MEKKEGAAVDMAHYHLLVDTAALAGSRMLVAGAETCRVEDTIQRILKTSGFQRCEAFVIPTGIMITLEDYRYGIISVTRRIQEKQTNLENVDKVNTISRKFCAGELDLKETFHQLKHMTSMAYPTWVLNLALILTAGFFSVMLGGGWQEFLVSFISGLYLVLAQTVNRKLQIKSFIINMIATFFMAFTGSVIQQLWIPTLHMESFVSGSIMAILPGVAMTTGIRDTLEGDFVSGSARIIEALVVATSLALGIGTGMTMAHLLFGNLG